MAQGRVVAVVTGGSDFWMCIEGRAGGLGTEGEMICRRPGTQQVHGPRPSNSDMFFTTLRSPGGWDPVRPVLTQPDSGQGPPTTPPPLRVRTRPAGRAGGCFGSAGSMRTVCQLKPSPWPASAPGRPPRSPNPPATGHGPQPPSSQYSRAPCVFQMDFCNQNSEFSGKLRPQAHAPLSVGCQGLSPEKRGTDIVFPGTKMSLAHREEWAELWFLRSHSNGPGVWWVQMNG